MAMHQRDFLLVVHQVPDSFPSVQGHSGFAAHYESSSINDF
jgi:hypothetical protein